MITRKGVKNQRTKLVQAAKFDPWSNSAALLLNKSPNNDRLQRFIDLVLRDLLAILHALYDLIDLVALLAKGYVVLVSGAGFALGRFRRLLQIGNRLGVRLSGCIAPRDSDGPGQNRRGQRQRQRSGYEHG
jgi:hypothetical protein